MLKSFCIIVVLLTACITLKSQTTFQSKYGQNVITYVAAVKTLHEADPSSRIIAGLYSTPINIDSLPQFKTIIKAINEKIPKLLTDTATRHQPTTPYHSIVFKTISSGSSQTSDNAGISLPTEARIINAAAELIIDRLQQELALSFFKNFREKLEQDTLLSNLLPRTDTYLKAIAESSPLIIPSLGTAWKGAFEEDLKNLPENFVHYYFSSDYYKSNKNSALNDCLSIVKRALETYNMIRSGRHPSDIIHYFRLDIEQYLGSTTLTDLQQTVRLLDHLSQNLLSPAGGWTSPQDLKILEDNQVLNIFLRLFVYDDSLQYPDKSLSVFSTRATGSADNATSNLLKLINDKKSRIKLLLDEFRLLTGSVENSIDKIKNKQDKNQDAAEEDYRSYVQTVFDAIKFGHKLYDLRNSPDTAYISFFKKFLIPLGETTGEMILAINKSEYGSALSDFITILSIIQKKQPNFVPQATMSKLLSFSSFMMDVITSKTVDETKQALQSAALPAGSYTLKRKSSFSVNLSAYPGLSYGWETVQDTTGEFNNWNNFLGLSVPIGIDLTFGAKFLSISAVLGIADLGTLVSYRLNEKDSISSYPVVSFRQIFSPSAGVQIGIGDTPLTLGFLWQLAPQLREVTTKGVVATRERDTSRLFFTLGIDLNFFNFYTTESTK